ncbi:MAG: hypothetical protein N2035_05065 [Chthoniobacterales bacterium]|nr:hypothetical protein [Chthoniobacterales bacterium]
MGPGFEVEAGTADEDGVVVAALDLSDEGVEERGEFGSVEGCGRGEGAVEVVRGEGEEGGGGLGSEDG